MLEKRGRFLTAEPLFGAPHDGARSPGATGRGSGRVTVEARGARGAERAGPGDLVLVQISGQRQARPAGRGAQGQRAGTGRILRRLGRPDVARDVIEGLMLDRGLRRAFDPAVEREAREACDRTGDGADGRPEPGEGGGARRDLRGLPTFTIDPAGARDFDDAISAERLDGDRVRVWVHIADVSAYVPEGSLVDREARRRATSVYVPGAVEPMLPLALSSDACSLIPGRDRLAVTVQMDLHGAQVALRTFFRSLIRSDERLDYERVDRIFAGQERAEDPWAAPLFAARQAAAALDAARHRRAGLTLDRPEPEFSFDERGHVREVRGRSQTESHRLIEHLMIAANESVARLLAERSVPCLYRVHERPAPERVGRLAEQLASLGVPTPPMPELLAPSQAAELVGEISRDVDAHVRRTGHGALALTLLVLRSLKQAYYSPRNLGHAGLGSSCYCHFTSPIRRYPDLVCHRALLSALGGDEHAPRSAQLEELGSWTSDRERAAMIIERDADDVARCFALEQVLFRHGWDQTFAGEVTGLIGAGAFLVFGPASADAPVSLAPYEGMLPVRRMRAVAGSGERDWWELNEEGTILFGSSTEASLRLGDVMDVRVRRVETARGRVDLEPAL